MSKVYAIALQCGGPEGVIPVIGDYLISLGPEVNIYNKDEKLVASFTRSEIAGWAIVEESVTPKRLRFEAP